MNDLRAAIQVSFCMALKMTNVVIGGEGEGKDSTRTEQHGKETNDDKDDTQARAIRAALPQSVAAPSSYQDPCKPPPKTPRPTNPPNPPHGSSCLSL